MQLSCMTDLSTSSYDCTSHCKDHNTLPLKSEGITKPSQVWAIRILALKEGSGHTNPLSCKEQFAIDTHWKGKISSVFYSEVNCVHQPHLSKSMFRKNWSTQSELYIFICVGVTLFRHFFCLTAFLLFTLIFVIVVLQSFGILKERKNTKLTG